MPRPSSIQWKALLMLMTFSVSFTVFCHCAAMAAVTAPAHCRHCRKKASKQQDDSGCRGMQAVKFHLLEKQTADPIHAAPAPLTALIAPAAYPGTIMLLPTEKRQRPQQWYYKHSPPDRLSLYQCFLI
ncbi:MAG TPA: hypothetical protein VGS79_08310 [Puia sp.]|nr:hypothetical protein [Puia sp.]